MTEKIYFRPVIPLVVSLMTGLYLGSCFPDHRWCMYVAVCMSTAVILWSVKQKKAGFVSPLILFAGMGYLSIQPWVAPEFNSHHIINQVDSDSREIVGVIDTPPWEYANRKKFILQTEALRVNNRSIPVTGKIRVTVAGKGSDLFKGDRISFRDKIRSVRNFNNPGGFDYKRYMALKMVWGTSYVSGDRVFIEGRNPKKGIQWRITRARNKIAHLIDTTDAGKQQEVLKALIVGDKNSISPDLREAFNRAGVGHLLAISGLHIGIVATAAFVCFRFIFSRVNLFLLKAWSKKGAVILSIIPVMIYGALSGMSPSTQRAVIMVIVFLMALLFEREQDTMNTLAVAALVIVVVHPPSLFSVSFQLSFTAVLTIIYGMSKLNVWVTLNSRSGKRRRYLQFANKPVLFFLTSFFAILGTLPLVMFYFNQISLVGLLTNLLVVPLVGFLVVPLGLLSVLLYPLTVSGSSLCIQASIAILTPVLRMVNFFSALPYAAIKTITPSHFEICCYYMLFWAMLNLKSNHPKKPEADEQKKNENGLGKRTRTQVRGVIFKRKPAKLIFFLAILASGADAGYWLHNRFWHQDLRVTIIDVGHGNAALLELPGGSNILIDGGGFSDNNLFDVGARIIAPLLWRKKIKTVDTLVLSHANSDHLNGLTYIAANFNVKRVWSNNEPSPTSGHKNFMDVIEKNKISMPLYKDIFGSHEINGVRFEILYPSADFFDKKKSDRWRNINNNSLVVRVLFGNTSFLFPGDIKARAEEELVSTLGHRLKSTVLLAPHHGSRTSSTRGFLGKVSPEIVIMSSGLNSRFGFPHLPVLERYQNVGCRILVTARHGAIIMSTDGKELRVKPTVENQKM